MKTGFFQILLEFHLLVQTLTLLTCDFTNGEFLNWNGSCIASCDFPLYSKMHGNIKICDICPTTYILLPNGTCLLQANDISEAHEIELPLVNSENSCPDSWFLYENSSCKEECPPPHVKINTLKSKFCYQPCRDKDDFLYQNGTCHSICSFPLIKRLLGANKICEKPCQSEEFFNWDYTCTKDCVYPMKIEIDENNNYICQNPCTGTSNYFYEEEKTCKPTCEPPYIVREHGPEKSCTLKTGVFHNQARVLTGAPEFIIKIGRDVTDIFITIASTLGSANPASFTLAGFVKMVPYIRYMDISYPPRLEAALDNMHKSLISFSFGPSIPANVAVLFPNYDIPEQFEKYGLYSSFFVNYWQTMTSLGIILGLITVFWTGFKLTKKMQTLNHVFEKLKLIVKWNFFLIIFCTNFDGVALYTSLEVRSLHLDSVPSVISFIFCIFVNLGAVAVFCLIIIIVLDLRRNKNQVYPSLNSPTPMSRWNDYQLLFKGSKSDTLIQQIFMFPFLARIYIFNLIIAHFFEHPLTQATIILSMNVIMILYMVRKKPFISKVVFCQHVSDEIILLSVNICLLTLAMLDSKGSTDDGARAVLGDVIVVANIILSFSSLFFLLLYVIVGLQAAFQAIKIHKTKGILSILLVFLSPFEAGGMDMELVPTTEMIPSPKSEEIKNLKTNLDIIIEEHDSSRKALPLHSHRLSVPDAPITISRSVKPTLQNLDDGSESDSGTVVVANSIRTTQLLRNYRRKIFTQVSLTSSGMLPP